MNFRPKFKLVSSAIEPSALSPRGRWRRWLIVVMWLFSCHFAQACKLPVFRYALERWEVDRYRIVALVENPEASDIKEAVDLLQDKQVGERNVDIEIIDVNQLTEEQWWQLEGVDQGVTDQLQVYFPTQDGNHRLGWSGELTGASVLSWLSSPLREALVKDLAAGVSAVWVLVEGADESVNAEVERKLLASIARANQEIKLPEGVITQDEAAEYFIQNPGASMDDVLRCRVPLRVDFQLRRLAMGQAEEVATLSMIESLGIEKGKPFLVPIFGRGRMLDAIPAESLNPEVVLNACRYMVGECSCTVKAQNPGIDLLLTVDWQEELQTEAIVIDPTMNTSPLLLTIPSGNTTDSGFNLGSRDKLTQEKPNGIQDQGIAKVFALSQSTFGRIGFAFCALIGCFFLTALMRRKPS